MRPRFNVLLCSSDGQRSSHMKLVLETRLKVSVTLSDGLAAVTAIHQKEFRCAVLLDTNPDFINVLRKKSIPSLEIGKDPSYADRSISGELMSEVLQAVNAMCARKRGPKQQRMAA